MFLPTKLVNYLLVAEAANFKATVTVAFYLKLHSEYNPW